MKTLKFLIAACMILVAAPRSVEAAPKGPVTSVHYLSGKAVQDSVRWDFFCTAGENSGEWTKIIVPSCWETQGFGVWEYGTGKADESGLYRHSFKTPSDFAPGKAAWLVFEAAATDTEVILNGQRLGLHQGGFYPFRFDVAGLLKTDGGDNLLEVNVCKRSSNYSVNHSERMGDYWNYGGIFRAVHLDIMPALNIDRIALDPRCDGQTTLDYFLSKAPASGSSLVVSISDLESGKALYNNKFDIGAEASGRLSFDAGEPIPWSDEDPHLYVLNIELCDASGAAVHALSERIGFRTFEVREHDGLYLNGTRVILKGINHHTINPFTGRTLTRQDNIRDAELIKEMNMNAVRLSHYPQDKDFYDACDSLGIMMLDELSGWHGSYDTDLGRGLVEAMVCRDVNHPAVVFWDNGNEEDWNFDLDDDFGKWDPQNRHVLHPLGNFRGVETMHYRSYGESQDYLRGPDIFMPTEILHGQFDGGHGAGMDDYWKLYRTHERFGGFFLWDMIDQGVRRLDRGGIIDTNGDRGTDGIMGPQREKEGSFFTVREVLCPVQMQGNVIGPDFRGKLNVSNEYAFTSLDRCTFEWQQVQLPTWKGGEPSVLKGGRLKGPGIAPGSTGVIDLRCGRLDKRADVLYVKVFDPKGKEIMNWSWAVGEQPLPELVKGTAPVVSEADSVLTVKAGGRTFRFNRNDGLLMDVSVEGAVIPFGNGPHFTAARRADRSLDRFYDHDVMIFQHYEARDDDRKFKEFHDRGVLRSLTWKALPGGCVEVTADYDLGTMRKAVWTIDPEGTAMLDYDYFFEGVVDLMGVKFDFPEGDVLSKRWNGGGPYRIWKNRTRGTTLGVWENDYNDTTPTLTFDYPEFKGYFGDTQWMQLHTKEGNITIVNTDPAGKSVGVYEPKDGPVRRGKGLFTLPKTGISLMDVTPAVRNKVNSTDLNGPSAQAVWADGHYGGRIYLIFDK